jgi:hypothetical protein
VRIVLIVTACLALLVASCGGGSDKATVSTDTSTVAASTTTSSGPTTTSTTVELPTTSLPCQPVPIPPGPITSPVPAAQAALLTKVQDQSDGCVDHVIFDYTGKGTDPPGYTVSYGNAPFVGDGSGAPIAVAGTAFVVVTVKPGYGFDFETGKATYTGPKSVPVGHTNHVKAVVETADFEGTLTWVIGLDAKRAFSVQATGTPRHQLVVTIS